jgi:hypothetical protein
MPGLTRAIRGPVDRLALVQYVRDTSALQEKDWVEWKSGYDLTTKPGRASVAKHLIGFANRDPSAASSTSEGFAYLLLGVEPGAVPGMDVLDSADIENGIRPFVGDELRFDIDYVPIHAMHVLFFVVDPPKAGDPIHCLRKESVDLETGKALRAGTIYVRKAGKTEQANPADIDRLTERAKNVSATVSLSVDVRVIDPPQALPANIFSDGTRDRALGEIEQGLMKSLPAGRPRDMIYLRPVGETRSRDGFERQVNAFVKNAKRHWWAYAAVEVLEASPHPLRLELVNPTEHNYADVVVELRIPLGRDLVHLSVSDARHHLQPPEPPEPYGTNALASHKLLSRINPAVFRGPQALDHIDGDRSSTNIRFGAIHVRPLTPHQMPDVYMILGPPLKATDIPVEWRATSSSTSGQMTGTVIVSVP